MNQQNVGETYEDSSSPEAVTFGQELSDRYDVEVLDISDRAQLEDFAPG